MDILKNVLRNEAGEGGEGGGADPASATFTQEQVDAKIQEAVSGMKTKNNELLGELKNTREALKPWEGLEADKVKNMLDKFENDEELKLIAEGKHEEAWQKRLEKVSATHQSQIDGVTQERDTFRSQLEQSQEQVRDLIIDQRVLSAFMQEKGLETAAPDVVLRAKNTFKVEDGQPIARDSNGEIIRGKDGPITVDEWVASLKQTASHLFPGSQGAGATGAGASASANLEAQMEAAASKGDMNLYRELRDKSQKAG